MADVISSHKKDAAQLLDQFKLTVKAINNQFADTIISPLTITLGDEFQGISTSVSSGVLLILAMEEFILANAFDFKLRYILAQGQIETPINTKNAHEMMGEGLTHARKQLNNLKNKEARFLLTSSTADHIMLTTLNDSFKLYQHFIDSWKVKDYPLVHQFLMNEDYKKIASQLNLNKSTTWRRKKSLLIDEYRTSKNIILNLCKLHDFR